MARIFLLAGIVLCSTTVSWAQSADDGAEVLHLQDGVVSYGHHDQCPGCRAFLAGYGHSEVLHGSSGSCSCACNAGTGAGAGTGGLGYDAAGMAGGDYVGPTYGADPMELAASDFGAGRGYGSVAPGMVGDFFGGAYQINAVTAGQSSGQFTNLPAAGGDRRFKISENYSPFPIDRVFFNYNHFHRALETADGREANLNRATFGVEKTFLDQWWSYEFRLPFASGLNNDQVVSSTADNVSTEFGNIAMALKRLVSTSDTTAVSAGLGIVLPSGANGNLYDSSGTLIVTTFNDAVYLQPFLGLWYTPTDRFFAQFNVQADFDVRGNRIDFVQVGNGPEGTVQDQALLFLDGSIGYWIFRDPYADSFITGLAPIIELHHNTTIEDPDQLRSGPDEVTNPNRRLDVLNLTGALRLELAGVSYLTFFGVAPLRDNEEKLFDAEFGVQYTRLY